MSNESEHDMTPEEFAEFKSDFRHQGKTLDELKSLVEKVVEGQSQILIEVPLLKQQMETFSNNQAAFNEKLASLQERQSNQGRTLESHITIWKIVGVLALSALGLVGWGWKELDGIKKNQISLERNFSSEVRGLEDKVNTKINSQDRRLSLIEYQVGSIPPGFNDEN